jgi:hypothetical protein
LLAKGFSLSRTSHKENEKRMKAKDMLLLAAITVAHAMNEITSHTAFEDLVTVSEGTIPTRHLGAALGSSGSPSQNGEREMRANDFLQELASVRRPVVLTGLGINGKDYDLERLESWTMDNVRWSKGGDKTVFAIRTPKSGEEGLDGVLRTEGWHDVSPTTRVLTPEADGSNMLHGVEMKRFAESDGGGEGGLMYWTADLWSTSGDLVRRVESWWKDFLVRDDLGMDDVPEEVSGSVSRGSAASDASL